MGKHFQVVILLIAITCLTRIPFSSEIWHYDSLNFALALDEFNIAKHQPHPPGYILYIGLGKALNLLVHDANKALIILSVLFSCVAVVSIYLLAKAVFGHRSGVISALFLLSSPVFWTSGELPLSYAAIPAGSLWVAYASYKIMQGELKYADWASAGLGLVIGIRQDMWIFLLPLWMASLVWLGSWKAAARQVSILGTICLLWIVPLMILSGGVGEYWDVSGGFWASALWGRFSFAKNVVYIICGSAWTLGAVLLVLPAGLRTLASRVDAKHRARLFLFLLVWAGPSLLFYLTSSIGKSLHTMKFTLPIVLLSGAFAYRNWTPLRQIVTGMIVAANCLLFLLAAPLSEGDTVIGIRTDRFRTFANFWMLDYTRKGLLEKEQTIEIFESIKQNFSPDTTAIAVADGSDSVQPLVGRRLVSYHLPDFTVLAIGKQVLIAKELPPNVRTIVWLVDERELAKYEVNVESLLGTRGSRIYYSHLEDTLRVRNRSLLK